MRVGYAVLGGSRRRLDGVGLGYLFLDASHFKYRAGAAAELMLAAWESTPAASPCSSAWTPQRPGPGMPGPVLADFGRARPGLPLLVICGGAAGLIAAAVTSMARRAAPALSLAMAIETVSGLRDKELPCVLRVPVRVNGTWIGVFSRLHPQWRLTARSSTSAATASRRYPFARPNCGE